MAVPVTILPQEDRNKQLFQGLSTGLQSIMQGYGQQQQAQKQAKGLAALLNVSPEQAQEIAQVDPAILAPFVKELGAAQKLAQKDAMEQSAYQELYDTTGQMSQEGGFEEQEKKTVDAAYPDTAGAVNQQEITKQANKAVEEFQPTREKQLSDKIATIEKKLSQKDLNPTKARVLRKELSEQQKVLDKISQKNFDATQKLSDEIENDARQAREALEVIERQKELVEKGEMTTPGNLAFLEGIGLERIDALKSGDTQEFIKNNGFFLKNLKSLFGGRITDREMTTFLQTIANEWQSPEGMRRILLGMEKANKASIARADAYDRVLEQNANIPPRDMNRRVNRLVKPELDRSAKEWKQALSEKELPDTESKYVTAAKALAGQALGEIGPALKRAGTGAIAGAAFGRAAGAPGIASGAALGGLGGLLNLFGGTK